MRKNIATVISMILLACSCNFLDVVPSGTPTLDDIFSSKLQAERFLYDLYARIPNIASFRYMPDMCAGGDIITGTNGQTRWYPYKSVLYGEENANNTYFGLWDATSTTPTGRTNYDMYKGIRYAYVLIDNIDRVPNMYDSERNRYRGEAYFLIGYFYWCLMEHYGPVVIVDKEISINSEEDEIALPRSSWDECSEFVCDVFDKAAELLPPTLPRNELGRATSIAAKAYKARVLMYSASPLVNGNKDLTSFTNYDGSFMINPVYDKEKWMKAMTATKDAIDLAEANGCKLYEDPASAALPDAQRGKNNYYFTFLQKWNEDEFLYAFGDQTGPGHIQLYGSARQWDASTAKYTTDGFRNYLSPTLQLVETYQTANGLPLWADPSTKAEYEVNRLLSYDASGVAKLHKNRDPRFYATVGYDRGTYMSNGNSNIQLNMRCKETHGYTGEPSHEFNSCTGYLLQKFISVSSTYNPTTKAFSYAQYAFPLIRLAELYLDYAEADFEYDGKLDPEGLKYLNKVRRRAGLPNFETSWSVLGGMPAGETMRRALHEENMSELACEGRQYNNLRRWNIAQDMLGEVPDVLNIDGRNASEFYKIAKMRESGVRTFVYPKSYWLAIPMAEIENDNKLVQNPGY